MIDINISEGFTSAIDSKNNIKNSLVSLGVSVGKNDNFSTYGTKIIENLTLKSEVDKGKGKIATAITSKGVTSTSSDSFEEMAQKITEGLTSKSEVDEGKEKIATAITNKGIITNTTDSLIVMAENIDKIKQDGANDSFVGDIPSTLSIMTATQIMPYFYYFNSIVGFTNTTIENLFLKNAVYLRGFNFSLSSLSLSIRIKNVECPNLIEMGRRCFYNGILSENALTEKSFPKLEKMGSDCLTRYVFSSSGPGTEKVFPMLKEMSSLDFDLTQLSVIYFPSLEITSGYWKIKHEKNYITLKFPKLINHMDYIYNTTTQYRELSFNECIKMPDSFYKELFNLSNSNYLRTASKIVLPRAKYIHMSGVSGTIKPVNWCYLHLIDSNLLGTEETIFENIRFLIFGFKEKNDGQYNDALNLGLPSIYNSDDNPLQALIFQQGSRKYFENESDKIANSHLIQDLSSNNKCRKLIQAFGSTGYLYLSDLDYDAFMAIVPQETDTSVIALKERTRKWSEYKDFLLNTYMLDSIADWYE